MRHLVAVGAIYLDTILTVPQFPREDEKQRATTLVKRRGGNCPNSVEVLEQLLLAREPSNTTRLSLVGVMPARGSMAVQMIKATFESLVDLTQSLFREDFTEPASSYIIRSAATGSRTIVNYNNLPEMTVHEFINISERSSNEISWYHFEGRIPDVAILCIRHIRQYYPRTQISVEVEKPARDGLRALAAEADVVFYSKSWAMANGYESPESCLRGESAVAVRASLLCCTWGEQGACALEVPSGRLASASGYTIKDVPVVDTVGAGDTFIAGMLYGLALSDEHSSHGIRSILRRANRMAGKKVLQEGLTDLAQHFEDY